MGKQKQVVGIDPETFNEGEITTAERLVQIPCRINHTGPANVDTFMVQETFEGAGTSI